MTLRDIFRTQGPLGIDVFLGKLPNCLRLLHRAQLISVDLLVFYTINTSACCRRKRLKQLSVLENSTKVNTAIFAVMDLMQNNLHHIIYGNEEPLDEYYINQFLGQLLRGLEVRGLVFSCFLIESQTVLCIQFMYSYSFLHFLCIDNTNQIVLFFLSGNQKCTIRK